MAFARLLPPLSVPLTDLTGRIAIVTGGNSGIGYQIVLELAIRGSTVYIACPHTFNPQDTISQIISQNPALKDRIHHLTLDLSSPSSIRTFVDTCSTLHLPITHLFHNAGIGASLSGQDFTPDGLPTVYATNFLGSFLLTHLLEPHLAPTIADLDHIFRTRAVDLVAKACRKAIADWGGTAADITHTVAASSTSGGSPGYDLLVNEKLGIRPEAQRLLLSGIGCAGGLATVRTAATIANDATLRGRPARILGFACDLTSTNVRCDLAMLMENPEETKVSMALFSHAAGAFVLCNSRGLEDPEQVIYSILDWESGILPGTQKHEQCLLDPLGFRSFMSPDLPNIISNALAPMLSRMLSRNAWQRQDGDQKLEPADFDWALHPAGLAVLDKVRENLKLDNGQLRASFDVYESKGNSSCPTVLIILDKLRRMGEGRDNIVACSFGPGLCIEMIAMKRFQGEC